MCEGVFRSSSSSCTLLRSRVRQLDWVEQEIISSEWNRARQNSIVRLRSRQSKSKSTKSSRVCWMLRVENIMQEQMSRDLQQHVTLREQTFVDWSNVSKLQYEVTLTTVSESPPESKARKVWSVGQLLPKLTSKISRSSTGCQTWAKMWSLWWTSNNKPYINMVLERLSFWCKEAHLISSIALRVIIERIRQRIEIWSEGRAKTPSRRVGWPCSSFTSTTTLLN